MANCKGETNAMFPKEYKDIFGGSLGKADQEEQNYFAIETSGESKATRDWAQQQRDRAASAPHAAAPKDEHKDEQKH